MPYRVCGRFAGTMLPSASNSARTSIMSPSSQISACRACCDDIRSPAA